MRSPTADTLVIAFNFPPYNDGSAVTMAKRIIEGGSLVDVIAADLSTVRSVDSSLLALVAPFLNRSDYVTVPVIFASELGVRAFVEAGTAAHARHNHAQAYKHMFSRSMWAHSHFLAAELKSRGASRQWTAEFSDPLLWQADAKSRPSGAIEDPSFMSHTLRGMGVREQALLRANNTVLYWAQMIPFILADKLLFTNEQQFDLMLEDAPSFLRDGVSAKSTIAPHPTLKSDHYYVPAVTADDQGPVADLQLFPARKERQTFRIGYFGTFYPNRGGGDFLEALSLLVPSDRNRIRLDVYSDGARHLISAARTLGLQNNIRVLAPLPYLAFLRATADYDALLVNDIATMPFGMPSPFLPSKYSDYSGSRTPTMAITIPGSPLDSRENRWKANVGMIDQIAKMLHSALP